MLNQGPGDGQKPVVEDGDPKNPPRRRPQSTAFSMCPSQRSLRMAPTPSVVDTREANDIALFRNPPAPPDPLLNQIEDLDPVRDNRATLQLFQNEPYEPVGVQIGSFVLFLELELGGSYYSNVFHAPNAALDVALDVIPSARLVSNWSRHALEFRGIGGLSY